MYKIKKIILLTTIFSFLFSWLSALHAREMHLTIESYIDLVKNHHPEIMYKEIEPLIEKTIYEEKPYDPINGYGGKIIANYSQNKNIVEVENISENTSIDYGWRKKFIRGGTDIYFYNSHQTTSIANTATSWTTRLNLSVTQPILRGGFFDNYNQRFIDTVKINYQIAETTFNIELENYIKAALNTYWQYQLNKELLKLSEIILKDSRELLEFNKKRVAIGVVTKSEILTSESEVKNSEIELNNSLDALQKINENLKFFMGKSDEIDLNIVFQDELKVAPITINEDQAIETALDNREEFSTFAYRKQSIENGLAIGRQSSYFPRLDTSLTYSLIGRGDSLSSSFSDLSDGGSDLSWSVAFSLETDISVYHLATKRSMLDLEKLNLEEKAFVTSLRNKIRQTIRDIENNYRNFKKYEEILKLKEQKYEIGKKDYYIGKLDLSQFVQNNQEVRQAKISLLSSKLSYWEAILNFKLTQGTLLKENLIDKMEIDKDKE